MKIKQVDHSVNIESNDKIQGSITNDTKTHWGDIVSDINDQTDLIELVDSHVGKIDTEIEERIAADKKLDRRITNLEETIPEQLEELEERVYDELEPKIDDVAEKIKIKASAMYYDELCDFGDKKLWYMTDTNEILDPEQMEKEEILSHLIKDEEGNPLGYELGKGGGGGGGEDTEIKVFPINWPTTIAYGTECKLKINWYSLKDEVPTGPGTVKISIDGTTILTKDNVNQGIVTFDITENMSSLEVGTHKVEVKMTDVYANSARSVATITTVSISLTSNFNPDRVLTGSFNYTYIPNGTVEKKVHFLVDGIEVATDTVKTSGEQQTHKFSGWTHGSHTLKVYFTCTLDGNEVSSNELFYDLMYEVKGNKTPIITSTFSQTSEEQDVSFTIPYRVYSPGYNKSNIQLLINGEIFKELSVNQDTQYWENKIQTTGDYILQIKCGTVSKSFNINIYESEIPVEPVTEDLALYLNTIGRSNAESEEERQKWEDKDRSISCTLTGFNFSSDGWVQDDDSNTVLRIAGDARVTIPYKPFEKDFKTLGKTIELEFATSDVLDYEQNIISCTSPAPAIGKKDVYESELVGRTAAYTTSLNGNKFKSKVGEGNYGIYTFTYNGSQWLLNSIVADLTQYGLEPKVKILDPAYKEGDPFLFNGDKIVVTYDVNIRGFYVTPQLAKIISQQSELQTQYKENDHVRISFVIEKKNETHIIYMYVNAVMCGAIQYPESDDFRQLTPVNISIGCSTATVDIYNIRIYDNNLNRKQVVNNWIADTQNKTLKKQRYLHNDNYNEVGELVISKLPEDLPYIVWDIDPLPQYKGDKRPGNVEYVDQEDDTRNFTSENAQYNVQGTSSAVYPVKNIRIKFKQNKEWVEQFNWLDKDGNTIKKFKITLPDGIGDNYFTYKVDYASSEGANNVELTKLYNDASKNIGILTPPQKEDENVRVGIDGYPIIAFHKDTDGTVSFTTKANFNNDKANEDVYGFYCYEDPITGEPDYSKPHDESWEITNNSYDEAKFKKPATPETFGNAFEIRYPDEDGYSDLSHLQPMTEWVVSTDPDQATEEELEEPIQYTYTEVRRAEDGTYSRVTVTSDEFTHDTEEYRLTKFKAELADWFNVDSTVFYYIFTHLYLMIDSRAKNAFPTYFVERTAGDGGNHWFWLPYDMDTAIGINNEGKLVFDYNLEDTDQVDGSNVFNGQDSVMWNNLRKMFDGEIGQMYANLRTRLISYDETESRFEAHQDKWSESIFNEDSYQKYVRVLADTGANYLEMLQGSKAEQRKWWLYNRFKYFDSKYLAGDAKSDFLQFRAYIPSGVEKPDITVIPYADIYATASYANAAGAVVSKRATRGEEVVLENPFTTEETETDQETYIYSVSQLKSIGDISPFKPDTVDVSNAVRLQSLKVGDASESYDNPRLTTLALGENKLLRTLDVRGCSGLSTAVNVKLCSNLEEIYFDRTNITNLELPNAGSLKKLHLPDSITQLWIRNQPSLNELIITGTQNVSSLWIENIPMELIDVEEIITNMPEGAAIRLIGFEKTVDSVQDIDDLYNKFDLMAGLDAQGEPVETAQVNGKIYIDTIPYADWARLMAKYPDVSIISTQIICTIKFFNEDVLFSTQNIIRGQSAANPGTPHKVPNEQFYYTFSKWDQSYENVQSDLNINAEFESHIQIYTFKFDPQTTLVDPIPDETVKYNGLLAKPTDPYIEGAVFNGWFKEPETINKFDFDVAVTGPFSPGLDDKPLPITLYGKWTDETTPSVSINILSYNKFKFTITDNIAVIAYAITTSSVEPTEWTTILPVAEYTDEKTITESGTYYVWGKDAADHVGYALVKAYKLTKEASVGTDIVFKYQGETISDFILQSRDALIHIDLDSHYENLSIKFNGSVIENDTLKQIEQDSTVSTACSPKSYTVDFEMNKPGAKQEPSQTIVYNNLVALPEEQYIVEEDTSGNKTGYVIDYWVNKSTSIKWNFDTSKVSENTTLSAVWKVYKDPTRITVAVQSGQTLTCNFTQTESEGVTVNWGDNVSPQIDKSTEYGPSTKISFSHTYLENGTYDISFTCNSGIMKLGYDINNQVINPSSKITKVAFSYDVALTNDYAFKDAVELADAGLTEYMTEVAIGTFQNCGFTSLTVPRKITELKNGCFNGCSKLTSVYIKEGVEKLGESVFRNCAALSSIHLADTINDIGEYCFYECSSLKAINIPTSLKKISANTFTSSGIEQIDILENVEEIEHDAFAVCSSLEKIILRNKDLKVGSTVMRNCSKLKTAGPIGGNYNIEFAWDTTIPEYAFENSFTAGVGSQSYLHTITLPATITKICYRAFCNCGRLISIEIPDNVTVIEQQAFERCSSLTHTSIPAGCTYLGQNIFLWCSGLIRVDLHNASSTYKVDTYLSSWFYNCLSTLVLHIRENIIPSDAFGSCWNFNNDGSELTYISDLDE